MKIAIIGSRSFRDYNKLKREIFKQIHEQEFKERKHTIVSGGAKGADTLAERFAKEYNIDIKIFKADWATFGSRAGMIRNVDIIDNCDVVFAFWDGISTGTQNSISLAEKKNKEIYIIDFSTINFTTLKERIRKLKNI